MSMRARQLAEDIFRAGLDAADPRRAGRRSLVRAGDRLICGGVAYDLGSFDRVLVVGAGKASAAMAQAVEEILDDRLSDGILVVKDGYGKPLRRIAVREASHPVPDARGQGATDDLLGLLKSADDRALVICLLSGGGSALLVSPAPGISLGDKQRTTDLLLRAGASIDELNAVRKHLSAVKGGRLARAAFPAAVLSLILSDVIGDRLDVIASGPTAPDRSTFAEALEVVGKYGLASSLPEAVIRHLERGAAGQEEETVRADHPCFSRTRNIIVGSLRQAIDAANIRAKEHGLIAEVLTAELRGEASSAAKMLAERALNAQRGLRPGERRCLLAGGETTVTVRGPGSGGRNQELALAFALEVAGTQGITLLSAGTDGTDGPTDAAGAVVDGTTALRAGTAGLDPRSFLDRNDSYTFFRELDRRTGERSHLVTGPTGTNVMDLQVLLVEAP